MSSPSPRHTVVGTFADPRYADLAADAARKAGFQVERPPDGSVVVDPGERPQQVGEVEGILGAYGAREFSSSSLGASAEASGTESSSQSHTASREQRRRAEEGTTVELVEEQLRAETRSVQTGEVTIRKEVVTETRTIEVPVRREELVIERHAVDRRPVDAGDRGKADPLIAQLTDRLQQMQSGETLRIPIIEEDIVVHKRPVVIEEVTVGKRTIQETQKVSDTVRREEAHIEPHGEVRIREEK